MCSAHSENFVKTDSKDHAMVSLPGTCRGRVHSVNRRGVGIDFVPCAGLQSAFMVVYQIRTFHLRASVSVSGLMSSSDLASH